MTRQRVFDDYTIGGLTAAFGVAIADGISQLLGDGTHWWVAAPLGAGLYVATRYVRLRYQKIETDR
jgi:hypothetical protein